MCPYQNLVGTSLEPVRYKNYCGRGEPAYSPVLRVDTQVCPYIPFQTGKF